MNDYTIKKLPRTRAQFADALRKIDACDGAVMETQGKTLAQAWKTTQNRNYLTYWLQLAIGVSLARVDSLINRAERISARSGYQINSADALRKLVNYDGHRPGYAAKQRLGKSRIGRKKIR